MNERSLSLADNIPALRGLSATERKQVLEIADERSFAPGQKIIEQGQSSQHLWIVLEGKCEVVRDSTNDGPVRLAEMEPHQLFGEVSFFSPAPHSADVVARTPVRLLCIPRARYEALLNQGVGAAYKLAYNVLESASGRLRRMNEWLAELASQHRAEPNGEPVSPEWHEFRKKLFNEWNL
ncbi:MAG TPA: cyclic nucleotide-binding domain-containing protein [Pirellulales bacterium]|nr:cyclic nucleotide-binding domain-containing protein [Pirellulales bacterium]